MDNIHIDKSADSPNITLDYLNGLIEIEGNSYPGDAYEFYAPITKWLEEYFDCKAQDTTTVNMKMGYFNSATAQIIYNIFDIINDGKYNKLEINWYFNPNNEDAFEGYEDISQEFEKLTINPIESLIL